MTAPLFPAVEAVTAYLAARGAASDDDLLRVLEAREEEHRARVEAAGHRPARAASALAGVALLHDLVRAGRLRRDAAGLYSLAERVTVARGGDGVVVTVDAGAAGSLSLAVSPAVAAQLARRLLAVARQAEGKP